MVAESSLLICSNCFYPSVDPRMRSKESWCSLPKHQPDKKRVFQWVPELSLGEVWMFWESLKEQWCSLSPGEAFWLFSCQIFAPFSHPQLLPQISMAFIPCPSQGSSLVLFPKIGMAFKDLNHPGICVEIPGTAPSVPSHPALPSRYCWHCLGVLWNQTDPIFWRMIFPNRSSPACSKKGNGHPRKARNLNGARCRAGNWALGSCSHQDK